MEATYFCKRLITSFVIILVALKLDTGEATQQQEQGFTVFIRSSCSSTTYPSLCYTSLVKHADSIQTNRVLLTDTALNVTLAAAKTTSAAMLVMARSRELSPSAAGAMRDCVEELSDAVDELRRSIGEMAGLRSSNFEMTMSDVQTWVSAALTDESTCTDGSQQMGARAADQDVRGRIVEVAQLTSNALSFINQLATSHHP